ncbi:DUF1127 domain-containing protein [Rhodobacter calidifons]|nr:DUF1127 domain-containing protein [Rhodobacter calidifons]
MRSAALTRPAAPAPTRRQSFLRRLFGALALARSRRALAHLDDHLLRDIGLSRSKAQAEASRAAWDAPLHWRD